MSGIFHRQLAEYADYHRDQRNCLMHITGEAGILWFGLVVFSPENRAFSSDELTALYVLVRPRIE